MKIRFVFGAIRGEHKGAAGLQLFAGITLTFLKLCRFSTKQRMGHGSLSVYPLATRTKDCMAVRFSC